MLMQLAYVSRALIPVDDRAMLDIARKSLRNNARLGITGALYFDGGLFYQILEGPEAVVAVMFDTIRNDPRHTDITPLCHRPIATRDFKDWSMKFVNGSANEALSAQFHYPQLAQHGCGPQGDRITALQAA